ncbi:MAG: hypothetical protein JW893_00590 [Candidatus Omnitrophica bacterium]|nr:hypothetical protein [Candidatus Omnitrophota bacterium]
MRENSRIKWPFYLFAAALLLAVSGCMSVNADGIKTLAALGKDQKWQEEQIKLETKRFEKAKKSLIREEIEPGWTSEQVGDHLGPPVIILPEDYGVKWIYKRGNESWFDGEKIYFLFDEDGKLYEWKCVITECPPYPRQKETT